jgi:hypothetical protein
MKWKVKSYKVHKVIKLKISPFGRNDRKKVSHSAIALYRNDSDPEEPVPKFFVRTKLVVKRCNESGRFLAVFLPRSKAKTVTNQGV